MEGVRGEGGGRLNFGLIALIRSLQPNCIPLDKEQRSAGKGNDVCAVSCTLQLWGTNLLLLPSWLPKPTGSTPPASAPLGPGGHDPITLLIMRVCYETD